MATVNIRPIRLTQARLRDVVSYDPSTGEFRWRITRLKAKAGKIAGSINGKGYRYIKIDGVPYLAQRLAWLYVTGEWPDKIVDHADGDKDFNAFDNLRLATDAESSRNGPARKRFRRASYKGVHWHAQGRKWRARIIVGYKEIHLGLFDDPLEAHLAYIAASKRYHGAYGRID